MSLVYRQPLALLWSIPGAVLIGPALSHLSLAEVTGAYYATGLLMLALGLSGWVGRAMRALPMPIVMGMVAGVFLRFGVGWIEALGEDAIVAGAMTLGYFATAAWPAAARRLPPVIAALAVGILAIWATSAMAPVVLPSLLAEPVPILPAFSWQAMVELVVPLAITVLVVQNGQGDAILQAAGHRPPVNAIAAACGLGSLIVAPFGGVSTCLTGPVNAVLASEGAPERQYPAGVALGLLAIAFGLLAPFFTALMLAAPPAFVATLAGIAMLRVLQRAFQVAFERRFTLGSLVAFLFSASSLSILNIGAPFWGLVFGFAVSWALERDDFRAKH
jgi:benzoate membrane transport protein